MNRKLATSVALVAMTMIVPTVSAMAQTREAELRFENAQRRFDGELAIFKAEAERYERAKVAVVLPSVAPAPAPAPVVAEAPRSARPEPARDLEDEPRPMAPAPDDRGEPDDRPPL